MDVVADVAGVAGTLLMTFARFLGGFTVLGAGVAGVAVGRGVVVGCGVVMGRGLDMGRGDAVGRFRLREVVAEVGVGQGVVVEAAGMVSVVWESGIDMTHDTYSYILVVSSSNASTASKGSFTLTILTPLSSAPSTRTRAPFGRMLSCSLDTLVTRFMRILSGTCSRIRS